MFIQNYVINLDRSPDRLRHVQTQFQTLGLDFVRVPAVDAKAFSPDESTRLQRLYATGEKARVGWSLNYIAVFLSHQKAWSLVADGDAEAAAIFEDDVHLSSEMAATLQSDDVLPADADIVRLETTLQSMRLSRQPGLQVHRSRHFRVIAGAWGAAGYLLRRDTARWLAAAPARFHYSTDWMLFHSDCSIARALTVHQLDPAICVQDQYYPGVRRGFAMETAPPQGMKAMVRTGMAQVLGPSVRLLKRRRRVPFLA